MSHEKPRPAPAILRLVKDPPARCVLRRETELRLHNQLVRAFSQRFGAEHGLRVLVSLATKQLLDAGSSRSEVRAALCRLVEERVESVSDLSRPNANARAAELTTLMLEWSDRTDNPVSK